MSDPATALKGLLVGQTAILVISVGNMIDRARTVSYFTVMATLPIITLPDPILRKLCGAARAHP